MDKNLDNESSERHDYELSFLIKDESTAADISNLLRQHKAEIGSEQPPKKIDLAYKIKHESQAFFGCFYLRLTAADAKYLEHDLRVSPGVLRSLIIRLPRKKYVVTSSEAPRQKFRPNVVSREVGAADKKQLRPISNEALEKKIEEILQ